MMGQTAYAKIGWGIVVETGQLPWCDEDSGEPDLEEWWLRETSFPPEPTPFNDQGGWKNNIPNDAGSAAFFARKKAHLQAHPIPFVAVMSGSGDHCDQYVVCAVGSVQSVSWGGAKRVQPICFEFETSDTWKGAVKKCFPGATEGWYLAASLL